MKIYALLPIFLFVSIQASAQDCVRLICAKGDDCSITPARLTAKFPAGFEVTSIGSNTKIASRGDAGTLECKPVSHLTNEVSLDQISIYGNLKIVGKLQATGILRFEPNDGGELEFRPNKETFKNTGKFFTRAFERIKLDSAQPSVGIKPPKNLSKADCWQASATAELSDFSVTIGDTSSAGTYAMRARITEVKNFTKCTWGGE
ncbi:MAG: hypothetical protein K2Y28_07895 [Burkholderiaceae bacterium]|nr:hypothetical protein [Burkholderiaceae bacterium]